MAWNRRRTVWLLAGAFLATRALILIAAHVGAMHPSPSNRPPWTNPSDLSLNRPPPDPLIEPLFRWDAHFYLAIAEYGYPPRRDTPVYHVGYFPLYPLLVRGATWLVGNPFWASLLVSNALAFLGVMLVARVAADETDDGLRAGLWYLGSPGTQFLSFAYTEALFTVLLAAALLALRARRAWLAAILGAPASASRSAGVVVALAILVKGWLERDPPHRGRSYLAPALFALSGLFIYAAFCWQRYGDALAFANIEKSWARDITLWGPLRAFFSFSVDPDYYLVAIAAIAVVIAMVRRPSSCCCCRSSPGP
jgi:hypothetical protein